MSTEQRDALILDHQALVKSEAYKVFGRLPRRTVQLEDLQGAGEIGLIEAADRWNPDAGVPFGAFARIRIHGAIIDSLRLNDSVNRAARRVYRDIGQTRDNLRVMTMREPLDSEVQAAGKFTHDDMVVPQTIPLEHKDGNGRRFIYQTDDFAEVNTAQLRGVLNKAIAQLRPRHQMVITLHYMEGLKFVEIARRLGVNDSRISAIHQTAIEKLFTIMKSTGINGRNVQTELR